ncbi:MAG: hypothetical protein A3A86_06770 [Elusimicrobia bacterium RIFCSPLOWO2_01_FULL_60_11]|nr:MAG: hypothetical protein A3A86_06770 [Elusimicrobia bacterium RIFCSPLOWO2_01_FULL_60_11]
MGAEVSLGGNQIYPWGYMSFKGESLDMRNDLNYGQLNTFVGRARIDTPLFLPNIYLIANPMKFEGTSVRAVSFTYGDKTFTAAVPFTSSLRLDHYDLTLFYGVPFLKTATDGVLQADLGINVRYLDFKAEFSQPQTGISESKALAIPVPMGYLALRVSPIKKLSIEGELQGIAYGSSRYYDAMGRVKYRVMKLLFVAGGYSFQNIKIDQSDVHTDLRFGGPTAELGMEF